ATRATVVDAATSELSADPAAHRPGERLRVTVAGLVERARGRDRRRFAGDALGDRLGRVDGFRWHAVDDLDVPVPRHHGRAVPFDRAIQTGNPEWQLAAGVAGNAEDEAAVSGHAHDAAGDRHLAAGRGARNDQGALLDGVGDFIRGGCQGWRDGREEHRRHGGSRKTPSHRANTSRWPSGLPTRALPSHTCAPLTQVEAIREWKVMPWNGDQPTLDSTSSRRTASGVSSTSTRSAW